MHAQTTPEAKVYQVSTRMLRLQRKLVHEKATPDTYLAFATPQSKQEQALAHMSTARGAGQPILPKHTHTLPQH